MQIEVPTSELENCPKCEKPITKYWIGYSRTPYYVNCNCGMLYSHPHGGLPEGAIIGFNIWRKGYIAGKREKTTCPT